jgi:putative phosphoesterase
MKIVFFSDLHGNIYSFQSFLNWLQDSGMDHCYFLGDVFGYYYYQNEILDILRNNTNITSLLGNHDQYFLDLLQDDSLEEKLIKKYGNSYKNIKKRISNENVNFLKKLPEHLSFSVNNKKISIYHASPRNFLYERIYPDTEIDNEADYTKYDYVILGHTHHKMVKKLNSTFIFNPGSLGQQRDGKGASALVLDLMNGSYEFITFEYEINKLVNDIKRYDAGNDKLEEVLFRKGKSNENQYFWQR